MKTAFSIRQSAHQTLTCKAQFNTHSKQAIQPSITAAVTTNRYKSTSLWGRWAVSAALVATQVLAVTTIVDATAPQPAFANTENYTIDVRPGADEEEERYFQTVPQGLDISADDKAPRVALGKMLEGKNGKEVQQCVRKCIPTCTRTGQGGPGLGPMTARKEMMVFKEGYHSRQYCLSEVSKLLKGCQRFSFAIFYILLKFRPFSPSNFMQCVQVCNMTINKPALKPTP